MLDQALVTLDEFRGLFVAGEEDVIPPNHFKDNLNIAYGPGSFFSRAGVTAFLTKSDIRRIWPYTIPGEDTRLLILNGSGQLFDSGNSLVTPILTIADMSDFSAVSIFGRAYISPHDGQVGLEDEVVYVYDGTGTARAAAGVPPQGFDLTLASVAQTTSGTDIVAPVAPANGAQTLTTSPYIPNVFTKIKFFQTGGAVTNITITVVGFGPSHVAQTEIYVDKINSTSPTTYTTGELWEEITSITISGLVGAGGLFKVETVGTNIGKSEIGFHVVGVVYESDSGFLTKPGPENNLSAINITQKYRAISVSGIPATLPTGMAKTRVVISKFIKKKQYSGNADPEQYEMFFVPEAFGGHIAEGRTSTIINIFDADLVDSADYLLDNLSEIPAAVAIFGTSKGRMLTGGEFDSETTLRGSKGGEPEAISATDGFVICDPVSGGIRNLAEYRDCIYVYKSHATLITQDDNVNLHEWRINSIDKAIGAECHSIATLIGSTADTEDALIVADRAGIFAFNGAYPDKPLTWKIKGLWDSGTIDSDTFYKTQIAIDPVEKTLLVCYQTDVSPNDRIDSLLFGDFSEGLNWADIKWSIWEFYNQSGTGYVPETITSAFIGGNGKYRYLIGHRDATKIWNTIPDDTNRTNDDGQAINSYFETYKYSASESGAMTHIAGMRIKITGFGEVDLELIGPNDKPVETPASFPIPTSSNGNILQRFNFVEDDISIRAEIDELDESFAISKIWLFGTEIWGEKPSGLEFDLKLDLVSYWDFADSGNLGLDSHGSNNLTNNNGVTRVAGPSGSDFAGQFVRSSNQFLSIADNASLRLGSSSDGYTIALWVYADTLPSNLRLLTKDGNIAGEREYRVSITTINSEHPPSFTIFNTAGTGSTNLGITTPTTFFDVQLATWFFLVCWHLNGDDEFSMKCDDYLDRDLPLAITQNSGSTSAFMIGSSEADITNPHNGRIAHAGIWTRVLRAHEIEYLYNQGVGRSYEDL